MSAFLAAVYAREVLTWCQEALAWVLAWLVALAVRRLIARRSGTAPAHR